jgi:glycosyltransferase involved in cell wall biosynthesis
MVLESHAGASMGGAEYQAHLLATVLQNRPDVRVTYLTRRVPTNGHYSYDIRQVGNPSGFRRRSVLFDSASLWRALVHLSPNVIYQRMKQSYTGICGVYARHAGIPFVFHAAHDLDVNGLRVRHGVSPNLPLDLLDGVIGNSGIRLSTNIVVQTQRQSDLLAAWLGRRPSALIRNFQPLPDCLPGKAADVTRILWVGNLKALKRPQLFVELAKQFAGANSVDFWMVGRAGSQRGIRATLSEIHEAANLRYFGEVPLEEVNRLMCDAHIFVNTSSWEGSPNTFIQAWARGAVLVSLSVDVDDGLEQLGVGFRAGSMDKLTKIIRDLVEKPTLRNQIAEKAFAYVHREHSLANAEALADLIISRAENGWE